MVLISDASGGGEIRDDGSEQATLTVLKSDYSNGVFGFEGPEFSLTSNESSSVQLTITRGRGLFGQVTVTWEVRDVTGQELSVSDFDQVSGTFTFEPMETQKVSMTVYTMSSMSSMYVHILCMYKLCIHVKVYQVLCVLQHTFLPIIQLMLIVQYLYMILCVRTEDFVLYLSYEGDPKLSINCTSLHIMSMCVHAYRYGMLSECISYHCMYSTYVRTVYVYVQYILCIHSTMPMFILTFIHIYLSRFSI